MPDDERDDPSLLQFLMQRLDEDGLLIIGNTPVLLETGVDREFYDRCLSRSALIARSRVDREIVAACVEGMRSVQGPPPVPVPSGPAHEATVLGSEVLKRIASRFDWHPDYKEQWRVG